MTFSSTPPVITSLIAGHSPTYITSSTILYRKTSTSIVSLLSSLHANMGYALLKIVLIFIKLCESLKHSSIPSLYHSLFSEIPMEPLLHRWFQNLWIFQFCVFQRKSNLRLPPSKLCYNFNCQTPGDSPVHSKNLVFHFNLISSSSTLHPLRQPFLTYIPSTF